VILDQIIGTAIMQATIEAIDNAIAVEPHMYPFNILDCDGIMGANCKTAD